MDVVNYGLIYAGSALMVYNIIRCYGFVKQMRGVKGLETVRGILPIPLALLIGFLAGYLAVALFGKPDLIIAGILAGGSLFVFIVFSIMYKIINLLRENTTRSDALYAEIKSELQELAEDYMSVYRINLTKDEVVERVGEGLVDSDLTTMKYSEFLLGRSNRLLADADTLPQDGLFLRENLLRSYEEGQTTVEERLFVKLANDDIKPSFIKLRAILESQEDGDVVALMTENVCNGEMINEVILNKALTEQYDMITSLLDGQYTVVIGDRGVRQRNQVFPRYTTGDYQEYLEEQVGPVICGNEDERAALLEALSFDRIDRELANGEPYEVNIAVKLDGEVFYKRFVFYVIDRDAKFYLLLKSDTTEMRREEIERSEQLQEALEVAQRASQSKTTFLSNMSHDIRTPMNAIVGYTEFAKKCDDIEQAHEYLEKIDASNKYMLALINDVLEMSRIESGKLDLMPERTNLFAIMNDVRDMFETQMGEKGIAYSVDTSGVANGFVLCDKNRFNRVLLNLISNAYKFTPEGGSVSVRLSQLDGAPGKVGTYNLCVKDTGIGMSEEFAKKVFDAFERERSSTASCIQGTGLGTAITKRIVDMMGGTIDVITAPGQGTEFIVHIPFEILEGAAEEDAASGKSRVAVEEVDFTGMRVLLAEDNDINREIALLVLDEMGFSVDEARDGKEALDKLSASEPGYYDVVLTDIQMPVMDGYEEARAIRALDNPGLANIPIIAMSANAFAEDIQASKNAGMNGHIAKPVDVAEMAATLTEVLAK